jgi:DNA invertase Pin-like site-specific DNA recombinase
MTHPAPVRCDKSHPTLPASGGYPGTPSFFHGRRDQLHSLGIDLFLHQGIDTTTPAGKAMFQVMGVFAEFERAMIRERVNAGIARAKAGGKLIDTKLERRIRAALAAPDRPGLHKIAKQFRVGTGTVQRIAAQAARYVARARSGALNQSAGSCVR